ncbi:MAG: hypothetical protein KC635_01655 [Myxococcales bacterium]|nr:hypothetical protein [Myxococcales bacterium]MCB9731273.1 hypothetical protein [Deltaproteobacteria bacterium]
MAEPVPKILEDERLTDFIDERMGDAERARFEALLEGDPELEAEVRGLEGVVSALRRIPVAPAPDDFLTAVKSRIRRRTRGRVFGMKAARYRFPYEAVINGVLLGLLMAMYVIAMPTASDIPLPVSAEMVRRASDASAVGAAVLRGYGDVAVESAAPDRGEVVYRVEVAADRVADLENEVGLYPYLEVLEVKAAEDAGRRVVIVRARNDSRR